MGESDCDQRKPAAEKRIAALEEKYGTTLDLLDEEGLPADADYEMHEDYIMWHHWAEVAEKTKTQPTDQGPKRAGDTQPNA